MKDSEEILKEKPGSVIFARYAEKLARDGKIIEALDILNKGIETNPYYTPGYTVLSEIYSIQGAEEKSVENLEKALSLEPQSPRNLLNLGKYLTDEQPEKAKEYKWTAHRYEPGISEETPLSKGLSADIDLIPDTEEAFSELAEETASAEEVEEVIGESTGAEESMMEEKEEEAEISVLSELDEIQSVEEMEIHELSEKTAIEETAETSLEKSLEVDIDLIPDTEEAFSELAEETVSAEEVEEVIDKSTGAEESMMEEKEEEAEISVSSEIDEIQSVEETEVHEIPGTDIFTESAEYIKPEPGSDITDLLWDSQTSKEMQVEDLKKSLEPEEKETPGEPEKTYNEIDESLIGYSDLLDSESSKLDTSEKDKEETGVLEIEEGEGYDISKLEYDLTTGEIEEPVLTEQEREELLALEETSQDIDKNLGVSEDYIAKIGDSDLTDLVYEPEPEKSDDELMRDSYGDLSKDEIDVLSVTDTEPDVAEKDLEIETKEGIDYSDILYGVEADIESEDKTETVLEKEIKALEESEIQTDIKDVSPYETEGNDITNIIIDEDDVLATDRDLSISADEISAGKIIQDEKQETETGESLQESETDKLSIGDENIKDDMMKGYMDFELSFTEKDIEQVESSSLDVLIDDYVDALKDSSYDVEQEEINYSEKDISPEGFTGYEEAELELTGDKPWNIEVGEETDEATATMAEIFVSQGLITRAIKIYKVLLEKEPDNEKIKSRLEELQKMLDD